MRIEWFRIVKDETGSLWLNGVRKNHPNIYDWNEFIPNDSTGWLRIDLLGIKFYDDNFIEQIDKDLYLDAD